MDGVRVGVTAARKGQQLVEALQRRGAEVLHGATVGGDVPVAAAEIVAATDRVVAARPTWLVASTGVGMRLWAETADEHGRGGQLRAVADAARCVARGAKAVGGLAAVDATATWVSQQQTDASVAAWLAERVAPGERVAVQLHGSATLAPYAPVVAAGGQLLPVRTYRHALPDDLGPARALIAAVRAAQVDVVTFTSPGAVHNLADIAVADDPDAPAALRAAFTDAVAVAVVGPVTGQAVEEHGWPVAVEPDRWRTGDLLRALERWAAIR